jgi:hypothetical protein
MKTVLTPRDVWSLSDDDLLNVDSGKFGQVTITSEKFPFNLEDIGTSYKVLTERDIFPDQVFVGMTVLEATRKFISLVDRLNQRSIKRSGKSKYYIPGLETQQFFHNNEGKIPDLMKDGRWHHYVAASFRHHDGYLYVPCSSQASSSCNRYGDYVSRGWDSSDRFLVLEIIYPET